MKKEVLTDIYNKIKEYKHIIIHRHSNPDGDAMGAQIGLKEAILSTFPDKVVQIVGDISVRYEFMGKTDDVLDDDYNGALVIALDSGNSCLLSDDRYNKGDYLIKIDHHPAVEDYANINYVDTSRESCCGIICDLIFNHNMKLSNYGAQSLYTGIVTDSGRFRYNSTTKETFLNVANLMDYDFDMMNIYNHLYIEDMNVVQTKAKAQSKFKLTKKNVAYLINTYEDVCSYNMDPLTVSRSFVGLMAGIKGIEIWVNFTEDVDHTIMVEFRSNEIPVNKIAIKWGGGGHLNASGCRIDSFDNVDLILEDLDKLLEA